MIFLSRNKAVLEGACCSQHAWPEKDLYCSGCLRKGKKRPESLAYGMDKRQSVLEIRQCLQDPGSSLSFLAVDAGPEHYLAVSFPYLHRHTQYVKEYSKRTWSGTSHLTAFLHWQIPAWDLVVCSNGALGHHSNTSLLVQEMDGV